MLKSVSLQDCKSLEINGKVVFGKNVALRGYVKINCLQQKPFILENQLLNNICLTISETGKVISEPYSH